MIGHSRRGVIHCRRSAAASRRRAAQRAPALRLVWMGAALLLLAEAGVAFAQAADGFSARLTWVPISGAERDDVGGRGSLSATLSHSTLSVAGTFEGLPAAATQARLHQGIAMGARGPAIAELEVTPAAGGTLSGEVSLNADQIEALAAGRLYVQVHAERGVAPDNAVLWGWLLR